MTFKNLRIAVYADGADKDAMIAEYKKGYVTGFTTNPSLMKKAGVTDYVSFAKEVTAAIPDLPLSFEVFGDDFDTMEKEAKVIEDAVDAVLDEGWRTGDIAGSSRDAVKAAGKLVGTKRMGQLVVERI